MPGPDVGRLVGAACAGGRGVCSCVRVCGVALLSAVGQSESDVEKDEKEDGGGTKKRHEEEVL
jgi:hypothetical protein